MWGQDQGRKAGRQAECRHPRPVDRVSSARTIVHPQDKWTLLENVTPAIISEELFNDANAQLDKPKVRTGRPKNAPLVKFYAWSISV